MMDIQRIFVDSKEGVIRYTNSRNLLKLSTGKISHGQGPLLLLDNFVWSAKMLNRPRDMPSRPKTEGRQFDLSEEGRESPTTVGYHDPNAINLI